MRRAGPFAVRSVAVGLAARLAASPDGVQTGESYLFRTGASIFAYRIVFPPTVSGFFE